MGVGIPSNSDLNDCLTAGVYYCPSTAIANTISNTPVKAGFRLEVRQIIAAERYSQLLFANNNNSYQLYFRAYTGTWGAWYKVSGTTVE